ncbi:hypothetical protein GCM10009676_10260 [Prauserella halophila]|uniref:Uncharacterized protein n=1 Tax=Prauserella halophila TaxID=185641 RepID=A0ABP4GPK9_9PSEU|nr:hypothetical protein [Prauserella halophila]MCP2235383.1 hypothetical protein [Prauserella halophila]
MTHPIYCEQWCPPGTMPVVPGDGGRIGDEDTVTSCASCETVTDWLCHDVLPSIRRHGYYVPAGTSLEAEFDAMVQQGDLRSQAKELLEGIFPDGMPTSEGITPVAAWFDAPVDGR